MTAADGTLTVSGDVALIEFERRLDHPVEAVWAALTEPDQLEAWLGPGAIDPHEGGRVSIRTGPPGRPSPRGTIAGNVLAWNPPRHWDSFSR